MSSTNKTGNLGLNSWIGSDVPKREDFNSDNAKIDTAVGGHMHDTVQHVTQDDRNRWDGNFYIAIYYGNGTPSRRVETKCPFTARFAIVFAHNYPVAHTNFDTGCNYNYFALCSTATDSLGASLDKGNALWLTQSGAPDMFDEYFCLNSSGVVYTAILFR